MINRILLITTIVCIAAIGYLSFIPPADPIIYTATGKVSPLIVKAGAPIYITRTYTITRDAKITVIRRMRLGNCATGCKVVDLPASDLVVKPGQYTGTREMVVPAICTPGIWSLEFQAEWEDRIGRTRIVHAPPLEIEVI